MTKPAGTGHFHNRVAAFRFLGGVAILCPVAGLVYKWSQNCEDSILPIILGAVAMCGVLMELIDFKKQVDPVDISPTQNIFSRLGSLDPQYEYDRNVKWLKAIWAVIVALVLILSVLIDYLFMLDLCHSSYSYQTFVDKTAAAWQTLISTK